MMVLAWLLTAVTALLVMVLARLQLGGAPGGDRGVGWAFLMFWGHGTLLLLLLLLTLCVSAADRLPPRPWATTGSALLFVLLTAAASGLWALAQPSGGVDRLGGAALVRLAPLLGPTLLLIGAVLLLRSAGAGAWLDRLLLAVGVHGLVAVLVLVAPASIRTLEVWRLQLARDAGSLNTFQQQALARIHACRPEKDWPELLGHFRDGQHPILRAAAEARLAELPDWQQRALDGLDGPRAEAVFVWLSQQTPADPAAFAARLPLGIRQVAAQVRERHQRASHPSHLYDGLMIFEVERVLAAASRLHGHGVDFVPALRELRAAFAEPTPWPHPRYRAVGAIDRWIRRHD